MPPKPHQSHPIQPLPPNTPHNYVLLTLSLTNEAENSSSSLPYVVIAAHHYKEMRIALAQFHVTQPFKSTNRNPPRLTEHPFVTSFNPARPKISSVVNKYTTLLKATANCKKPSLTHRHSLQT